jgi:two-component system, LytTR family, sensor kinase
MEPQPLHPSRDAVLRRRNVRLQAALVLGGWTVFGLFSFAQAFLYWTLPNRETIRWFPLFVLSMVSAWIWAALTPAAIWVANRLHFGPGHRIRSLAIHGLAGMVFVVVSTVLERLLAGLLSNTPLRPFIEGLLWRFDSRLLAYLCIVTISQAARYALLYREREIRAAELTAQLARAELQVLKMQLQPHFLFNALNTIAELAHNDPNNADRLIARLGHLLRLSLEQSGHQVVPLRQELRFLMAYVDIEQTRFEDRLTVATDVTLEALEAGVPALLLQPLVENAIRHGVAPRTDRSRIVIRARRQGLMLTIDIQDDGPGFPGGQVPDEGLGLRNTRERLRQLYGDRHAFLLGNANEGGAMVTLALPFLECHEPHTPLHLRVTRLAEAAG